VFHYQTHGSIPPRCLKLRCSFNSLVYVPNNHQNTKQLECRLHRQIRSPFYLVGRSTFVLSCCTESMHSTSTCTTFVPYLSRYPDRLPPPRIDPAKRPRDQLFFLCVGACIAASTRNNCGSMTRTRIDPWVFLVWAFLVYEHFLRCSVDLFALRSQAYSFPWTPISTQCVLVLDPDFLSFLYGTNIVFWGEMGAP
jgi:hypothetical protein